MHPMSTTLFAWGVDLTPILLIANLAVALLAALISQWARSRPARLAVWGVAILSLAWWTTWAMMTGVKDTITVSMTWDIEPPRNPHPNLQQTHVVLYFNRNPNHHIGFYSDKLATYLRSLPSHEVNVVFEVTKDFGRVRAFREVQIGGLSDWGGEEQYGYAGASGSSRGPSPWP